MYKCVSIKSMQGLSGADLGFKGGFKVSMQTAWELLCARKCTLKQISSDPNGKYCARERLQIYSGTTFAIGELCYST